MTTNTTTKRPAKAAAKQPAPRKPRATAAKSAPAKRPAAAKSAPKTVVVDIDGGYVDVSGVDLDSLNRTELYNLAKAERAAYRQWEKAGSKGEPPATPAHDRLQDPSKKAKKATAERKSAKYDGIDQQLIELVKTARSTGVSFPRLAEKLNADSFAGRTDWTGPKIYAFACRHNVGKLPLVKGSK